MKKILGIYVCICLSISMMAETVFTFTSADDMNQTADGITVVLAQGSGQAAPNATYDYETLNPEMRLYLGNTITISATEALTNIQIEFAKSSASNKDYASLSVSTGELVSGGEAADKTDWKVDSWTGSATEVVFTLVAPGKQRQIRKIVIDGEPVIITPEEAELPTEADLDGNYMYQEPQIVHVPDTQSFQKEYAFIDGNILVHCSKGSIVFASNTEAAYFGCQAGETLTFTATQPFKGIAIKGKVRKLFSATCSNGDISYLNDEDMEISADPVLEIRNINSTSVTINCDKNLSCYEARVYFEETQDIDNIHQDVPCTKTLRDGQLIIIRGEKRYDARGAQL